jgi:hypothetical protein
MIDLEEISKNLPGGANMGGITQTIYAAYWKDVAAWPEEPDLTVDGVTLEDSAALVGDITFNTGKCFIPIYVTDDTGELQLESVGEKDGKSWKYNLSFFHPGLQKKALGFINAAKNENMVFLVPDNNGNFFLLGDALRPATYESSPDGNGTGKETSARSGISSLFSYKSKNIYHYEGSIPLIAAE